jgi:cytosine/adenosine deaminase-related metal-dependent hydrolase
MPGREISRRSFIAAGGLGAAALMTGAAREPQGSRILLKGGVVLSMDPKVGNFRTADVLIEGAKIAAVQPNLNATAEIIDASNMIVMPGFVDTHRHAWQGALRNIIPNAVLGDYVRDILGTARPHYRPQDVHIGDLISALGAINAGVTTMLDWSHIGNSPEHTDAAIAGLRESGIRAVYAFGSGSGAQGRYPQDIRRLRSQHFSSRDQLLTLALATGASLSDWQLAREVGASISLHVSGANALRTVADALGPDVTCIHCTALAEADWQAISRRGANVSIACPIEMEMGHGVPPIQEAIDHGVRPSLSVDVETEMPGDMFTQMRSVFTLQRMLAQKRQRDGDLKAPGLITARDVVEFATIEGAADNRLDGKIGSLTPGKEADIIMLRMDDINVTPVNNVYGAIVLGMDTSNVDTVFIGGKLRKRAGKLVGVDLDRVRRQAHESRDYIVGKTGWRETLFGGDLPGH